MRRNAACAGVYLMVMGATSARSAEVRQCASPELEHIAFMVGNWKISTVDVPGEAVIRRSLGGCLYEETLETTRGGRPYSEKRSYAFDRQNSKWDYSSVDTEHGNTNRMEGASEPGRLVLHHVMSRRGRILLDRVTIARTNEPGFSWLLETSPDGGTTWKFVERIDYRRNE